MKHRDIAELVDGFAPVILAAIGRAMAPVLERLEVAEKRVAELEAGKPEPVDLAAVAALVPKPADGKSVTLEEVRPLVDDAVAAAFAMVRVPLDGKDADPEVMRATVVAEVATAMAALPKVPTAEEVAALIPAPPPGKDADPELVRALVAEAVAALPKPENGKDATPEQIAETVEKALATWQRPKDGESVTIEQLQPIVDAAVDMAMADRPLPKDGVGLAGALKDHEGCLVLTLTDGALVKLGRVDGRDGEPGLGFDDLEVVDDGADIVFRLARGERVREWRVAKPTLADSYRGVWKEGAYRRGSAITWGGSLWIAQRDTEAKPESSDDWKLAVKRGRDGQDLRPNEPKPPAPVKLK